MSDAPLVFIDFETRSRVDLKLRGGRIYAGHDSSEQLCGVAAVVRFAPGGEGPGYVSSFDVYAWAPWPGPLGDWRCPPPRAGAPFDAITWHPPLLNSDDPPPAVLDAVREGWAVAHNADTFDSLVWSGLGLPPPGRGWIDTVHLARRRALPAALHNLSHALYATGKDELGAKIMRLHSIPKPARKGDQEGRFQDPAGVSLTSIVRYCAKDVLLLAGVYLDELGAPHHDDPVLAVHRAIEARGVPIDLDLVWKFREVAALLVRQAEDDVAPLGLTPTMLRSSDARKGLRGWLAKRGLELPDITSKTVRDALLRRDLAPEVRRGLVARLTVARVTTGKLDALLNTTSADGRLRDWSKYHGAHTGRWAGHGAQLHNFPRADEDTPNPEELAREVPRLPAAGAAELLTRLAAEMGRTAPQLLGSVLRLTVRAPKGRKLVTVDFSSVEARGLLWVAGDDEGLEVYRTGKDPYRIMASRVFGTPVTDKKDPRRQVGKVAVLACGYQGGEVALSRFAIKSGVDLEAAGVSAAQVVEAWRDAHPLVAGRRTGKFLAREDGKVIVVRRGGLWRDLNDAARRAVEGGSAARAGRCTFDLDGPHLVCVLPSGRPLVYREAAVEEVTTKWGKTREAVTFRSVKYGTRNALYGGLLTENVVQAICRDLLAAALVRLEAAAPRTDVWPVLHVHDEVVAETAEHNADALDYVREAMEDAPAWAAGFPVAAEGAEGERWGK